MMPRSNGPNDEAGRGVHPDLAAVAGGMRAAWREEQEAAAADAAAYWRHTRGLCEWLCDRMHAGDRIAVSLPARRFVGLVEEVGPDLVALRCPFGRVEIHIGPDVPIGFELVEHATSGGTRSVMRRGFHDALLARDTQENVTIGTALYPEGIEGTLFVGRDFVTVAGRSGVATVTPVTHVAWVTAAPA